MVLFSKEVDGGNLGVHVYPVDCDASLRKVGEEGRNPVFTKIDMLAELDRSGNAL